MVLSDVTRDFTADEKRRINHEWESIQLHGTSNARHERLIAMAILYSRPPQSVAEARSILALVKEAITLHEVECSEVLRHAVLDHFPPSQEFVLGLMDALWDGLRFYEKSAFYERIVQLQASAPTQISFDEMRPC
jgi:hypothetical protein